MTIVYPVHEPLMLRKARDARIMRMAEALSSRGHQIYLLIGRTGRKEKEILDYYGISPSPGLSIIQLPILKIQGRIRITINQVFLLASLYRALSIARIQPIKVFYFSVLEVADFFLKRRKSFPGAKFIYELHELARYPENTTPSPKQMKEERLEARVLSQTDGVITTTKTLRWVVASRFPQLPSVTIPLGTTAIPIPPPGSFGETGKIRVGYIGQLYDAQGVDIMIRAIALLPDTEAHIIGGTEVELSYLGKLAREQGVMDRVIFHGFVEPGKIPTLVDHLDILAVPAKNTVRMNYVAHIKIYEYMNFHRPIVAARLRSIEEELEDGRTGILVEPDDPQSLAEGISRLIRDPELAKKIAHSAYLQSANYHWEKRVEKIMAFINSLAVNG